ncbi:T1SS-143 domain-containing protein [Bradyrhizobium huanghuaihaiense]
MVPRFQVVLEGEEQTVPNLIVDESNLTAATNDIDGSIHNGNNTASAFFGGFFQSVSGADGVADSEHPISYALSIDVSKSSGVVDAQTSEAVVLVMNGTTVEGHTAASNLLVFTLSVDSVGTVTFTDYRAVKEADGTSPDGNEGISLASGAVTLTGTITDNDGDTATAGIDLGPQVTFLDDGPSIHVVVDGEERTLPNLIVDESNLTAATNGIDGSIHNGNNTASASFGSVFAAVTGADGVADPQHPISYALSIDTSKPTGLVDAQTNEDVVLVMNGTTVEGHTASSDLLVFTLSVDNNGVVTFTDDRAVKEADGTNPDTNEGISLASGVVTLTATIIDNDGDSADTSIDLGKQVTFLDDGPSVKAALASEAQVALDEGNTDAGSPPTSTAATIDTGAIAKGDDPDVTGTGYIAHAVDVSLVTATPQFGADGPAASDATAYKLTVTNAVSGLFVTDGSAISLVDVNGDGSVIVGVVQAGGFANQAAFAISINGTTGAVTVEQYLSLHQDSASDTPDDGVSLNANSLAVTVTITDGDGDQASAPVDVSGKITFDDDGPKVTATLADEAQVLLDEGNTDAGSPPTSTAATINTGAIVKGDDPDVTGTGYIAHAVDVALLTVTSQFGADGPATSGSTAYKLSVTNAASGLFVTDGSAISLVDVNGDGSVIVGVVQAGGFAGQAAFAISINGSTGAVTVEQYLSLHQDSASNTPDDGVSLNANSLAVTVTITDGDGDKASTPVDVSGRITFDDDGPKVTATLDSEAQVLLDEGNTDAGSPPTSTAATINTGAIAKGDDPDVTGTGYIAHAVDVSLLTVTPEFGADGPATAGSTAYKLTVTNAASGLFVTDGSAISLVDVNGDGSVIVGVVQAGGFANQAAFAISINGTTGAVTVEQYLSLHQDSASNTPDDGVSLNANSLAVTVTITDGDGDQASAPVDVSGKIIFDDDGPKVTATLDREAQVALDEGNTDAGVPPTSTAATINTGAIAKGDDPDVTGTGYIAHAVDVALLTVTSQFGADGPATSGSTAYKLSVTNAASGLFVTDGSAISLVDVNGDGSVIVGVVQAGGFAGQAAFAISINGSTGAVTVEQYLSLHQDSASNTPDDGVSLNANSLALTVTITDGDGDKASTPVDVSGKITFDDDGPKLTAVLSGTTAALDEGNTDAGVPPTSTAATINTGAIAKGDDPDVTGTGYIAHAVDVALLTVTSQFGADGPATAGSTAYKLSVTNAASGLFVTDGSAISLVDVNGDGSVIVGVVQAGGFANQAAFAISINGSTGAVTVEQYLSLHQDSASNTPDDGVSLNANSLAVTVTITDGDGDKASTPVDVSGKITFDDDGPKLTAVLSGTTAALDEGNTDAGVPPTSTAATINTGAIAKGDDPDVTGTGYIAHAVDVALLTVTSQFGADGPATSGSTAYKLSVTNAASGLFVTDGSAISLVDVNGDGSVIVGVVQAGGFAGQAAFAISINGSTGAVTVEQYLSLHQDSASNTPDDGVSLNANSLAVTVTITDGDGDKASTPVDVSGRITFDDDGPKLTAVLSGTTAALDEGNTDAGVPPTSTAATINTGAIAKGDDPNVTGTGYIAHAVDVALLTVTSQFGADGPAASGSTAYKLSVTNAASGLFVTDGSAINLVDVNGDGSVIVGVVQAGGFAGQAAFAISINGTTGAVTVEQYLSLHQDSASNTPDDGVSLNANSLALTVTITDGDGDKASTPVDVSGKITFDDDGPKLTAVLSGTTAALDEGNTDAGVPPTSTAATINTGAIAKGDDPDVTGTGYIAHAVDVALLTVTSQFGADGPATAGSTAYKLSVTNAASGLFVTDGSAISLVDVNGDGSVIVGVVQAGGFAGQAAFAISINGSTGAVTVEQYLSLHQDSASNTPDDGVSLNANSLALTVTITDGDGDKASTPVDVSGKITFDDDGPKLTAVLSGTTAALDEGNTDAGVPPTSTAATINTGAIAKGDDPNVTGTGYIAHAVDVALLTVTSQFGADGPATAGSTAYKLSVTNAASGLFVTDGSAISLVDVNGDGSVIVGVVQAGGFANQAAFAISINGTTGAVTVEQYLSLHQDSASNTPDDGVSLNANSLALTVTITDGDGDKASTPVDVSGKITFDDDGPKLTAVLSGTTAALDEGNTDAGVPPTSTAATINTGAIAKGDDPDVTGTGYIAHAVDVALLTVTSQFGADGPATAGSTAYKLSVTNAASGLFVTDGSAISLVDVNGDGSVIVGVVQAGGFANQAAFAISINGSTGAVTVEQYLSLHQDSASNTPDDGVSLNANSLAVTVTITDGDGDKASTPVDVSGKITFDDDGPKASTVTATPVLDDDAQTLFVGKPGGMGDVANAMVATGAAGALFAAGADGVQSISFTTPIGLKAIYKDANGLGAQETLTYATTVVAGHTILTATGAISTNVVFKLDVAPDGSYTFTESEPLVHPTSSTTEENLAVAIGFTVTDGDGDQAAGSLTVNVNDDTPSIGAIQDAIAPFNNNTQVNGTWQPLFGADGPNAIAPISVSMGANPAGLTYVITDTNTAVSGHELFKVDVKSGATTLYSFYEYTDYNPATKSGEMFAFTDLAHTKQFFELTVGIDGTYNFHVDTNTLQQTTTFSFVSQLPNGGNGDYLTIVNGTGTFLSGNDPATVPAGTVLIDGWNSGSTSPNTHVLHKNNPGLGIDNGNLDAGETVMFKFGDLQTGITVGIGKGNNATNEHFLVTVWDATHTNSVTWDLVQADGTAVIVDQAHWGATGTVSGALFSTFSEVDVTNIASGAAVPDQDDKVVLTTLSYGQNTTIASTTLNFALAITDGDGDTFTSTDNLTVSLVGTNASLTGTTAPEVIAASAANDTITGGTGPGDTVDYSNATSGVTVNLTAETDAVAAVVGGGATGDTIKGIENIFGSSFADTLTAHPSGSVLYAGAGSGAGTDVLNGGVGNDTLVAGLAGTDVLSGGAGNDTFVLHGNGGANVTISDLGLGDSIVVDVANLNLTINTAQTVTFNSGTTGANDQTHDSAFVGSNFFFNTSNNELYYSADNTAAHAVDLAHISTGIPQANAVHVA